MDANLFVKELRGGVKMELFLEAIEVKGIVNVGLFFIVLVIAESAWKVLFLIYIYFRMPDFIGYKELA